MKRSIALLLLPLLAAPAAAEPDAQPLADAVNQLGLDLYPKLGSEKQANLFFSPFSISAALTMTREGARGQTAVEMDRALHLPANRAQAYQALLKGLQPRQVNDWSTGKRTRVSTFALNIANNLWGQEGVRFQDPFLKTLRTSYQAPLQRLDFRKQAEARKTINDWIAKQTKDRIKNIIPEGKPTPATRLALANAIHFKAQWQHAFQARGTRSKPFHTLAGKEVEVKMMRLTHGLNYHEDAKVQVLELPYRGWDTSMVVILPKARQGLKAVAEGLTAKQLAGWIKGFRRQKVAVQLPKFEFTSSLDLTETLPPLMPSAFDPSKADFTGMTTEVPLYIGAVLHKAFVAVDEKGTEAAAATVVMMAAGSAAPRPTTPKPFVADHPFLFVIRHRKTGAVLFMGRVGDPSV